MPNSYFQFKQFTIYQDRCAMKVTTDACLFGAWVAEEVVSQESRVRSTESEVLRVLDIGTGTGLLSLMLAQKTNAIIDTVEIDKDAFEQAMENITTSPWKEKISIYHVDAKKFSTAAKYDIIVSNPPFYENELKSADERKNIAHHGGLALKELIEVIDHNLNNDGCFFLLLPFKRMKEILLLLPKHELTIVQIVLVKQSTEHDCFRIFIKGERQNEDENIYSKKEMAIWNARKEYTDKFIELLKDYYIYL